MTPDPLNSSSTSVMPLPSVNLQLTMYIVALACNIITSRHYKTVCNATTIVQKYNNY